jgi:hypothetical protein
MSFIESYKRLDNLCKDLLNSEKGITTYIENIEQIKYTRYYTSNFDCDYKMLKHYRYIRNQIVHDNDATEDNMCDENDIIWIEQFYKNILNQTDPLSLYHKAKHAHQHVKPTKTTEKTITRNTINGHKLHPFKIALIIGFISIIVLAFLVFGWILSQIFKF